MYSALSLPLCSSLSERTRMASTSLELTVPTADLHGELNLPNLKASCRVATPSKEGPELHSTRRGSRELSFNLISLISILNLEKFGVNLSLSTAFFGISRAYGSQEKGRVGLRYFLLGYKIESQLFQ